MQMKFICNNLADTEKLAENLADIISENGAFISLIGNVGAGKTTFTKFVCKYLGIKEKVTSPSFVILNEYKSGRIPVYHFDLYRLEKEGIKSIINEMEEYSEGKFVTFVEWAEFSQNSLPFDRVDININYLGDTKREFCLTSSGEKSGNILKRLEQ